MTTKLNALIIDDEKHCCEALTALLELYCPQVEVAGTASNLQEAVALINQFQPQIVFLDVEIGEENGFDLLEQLAPLQFQLIFITGHAHFAHKAFRVNAADYLLKPIDPVELIAAVNKVKLISRTNSMEQSVSNLMQMMTQKKEEKLIINTSEGTIFIEAQSITDIEGSGNYSTFHLDEEEKITASRGLKFYEQLLPLHLFFRTHQSHLINLSFVKKIWSGDGMIELKNGRRVPLSKNRKLDFLAKMQR